ncbi:ribonuclease Y [Victivallis sp. Marseille-Q1083]|uniref:ribonuclease Y n=1 Tax=Victivallis sp. Marseille-Q1083 TaxID=2717288 RepID=UPI001588995D|nr:ribonuclease Y [Victivallis sp. Marseille-Q1083]
MDLNWYWYIGLGVLGGGVVGWVINAAVQKARKSSAEVLINKMREEASKEAEHIQREAKVTAKSEILKLREECEHELKERRREQQNVEKRLSQREEALERKNDSLDGKLKNLERQEKEIELLRERLNNRENELQQSISKQIDELERVAQLDRETARQMLLEKLKNEVKNESGLLVRDLLEEAKQKAEKESRRILTYAIQRYASDCTYERTTATIPLPNDEMKGRIIGREGRNIRALEAATGVNILIDDTPEAVVISCFDPVRKEVARQLMERLIGDGRIHPTRIEELAKKIAKEVEDDVYSAGESAVLETGIQGVSPQVIKLLGRLKFRYSFSQNVLQHSLETAYFMGIIAAELGLDEQKAKRIGLFHDIGKAVDHEVEGSHAQIGADILRKHNEAKDVIQAVAAHHGEVEPVSLYDVLINACDTLSASRPGARSETTELYLKRLEQLESIAHDFAGVESCFALQAGREVRVVVTPEKISEGEAQMLAKDICQRIEKEMNYPGQIKVTIIRETRSVEYAK